MRLRASSSILLLALLALGTPAWAGNNKVQVCHVPPGNPSNFHTITVSENALQAHLGHGDLLGACFAHAASSATTVTHAPSTPATPPSTA